MRRIPCPAALAVIALAAASLAGCGGSGDDKRPAVRAVPQSSELAFRSDESAGTGSRAAADVASLGTTTAKIDFDPAKDGFSFENYGPHPGPDLTSVELQRLYGPDVCTSKPAAPGQPCSLIPPAEAQLQALNQGVLGGHCFGFSQLALRFFQRLQNPLDFGATPPFSLKLPGNEVLSREIAYAWATWVTTANQRAIRAYTPNETLAALEAAFASGRDLPTLTFYLRNGTNGHAITPIAVERDGDRAQIAVYDNNWPGQRRAVEIDTRANSWRYVAAQNPNEPNAVYDGENRVNPLLLSPSTLGFDPEPCPFCGRSDDGGIDIPDLGRLSIHLAGSRAQPARVLITTPDGKRLGTLADGRAVNEILGAKVIRPPGSRVWETRIEPYYQVPAGARVTITVDGRDADATATGTLTVIGPGFAATTSGLAAGPDAVQSLTLTDAGRTATLTDRSGAAAPTLILGSVERGPDTTVTAKPAEPLGRASLAVTVDPTRGEVRLGGRNRPPDTRLAVEQQRATGSTRRTSPPLALGAAGIRVPYGGDAPESRSLRPSGPARRSGR